MLFMNRIICLSILLFGFVAGRAQFPVGVQVNVVQPVPPYLPQIKADMLGQRASQLNQDITTHLSIVLRFTGRAVQRVKLAGSIERVAPSLMGVSLRPDFQPAQPILLGPAQPIVSLTKDMLQSAFGNFSENSLVYTNCDLNTLRQNGIDFKLPEGTYRICVTAYDYDKPGFSAPLSTPGTGCAYFTICYTASAPQLILPVSTFVNASGGAFQDLVPHSGQVQFTWTPPSTTCGVPMGPLSYNLEVRRVFPGQTVSDAVNNPFVFQQQFIPATTFLLDTLKYGHLLVPGQQYIVRVKANFVPMIGSPLEVANQGYSEIGAFTWSPVSYFPNIGLVNAPVAAPKPIPPGSIQPGGYINEPYTPTAACAVSVPIANTTAIGSLPGSVTIDGFPMTISGSSVNTDGSYKGSGYIVWRPYGSDVKLQVSFDSLRVNTDNVVYAGTAVTSSDAGFPGWSVFGGSGVDPVAKLTGLDDGTLGAIRSRMTDGLHVINAGLGGNPVGFPLGLSTTMGGAPFTLAVMGISFRSSCTNMNVLFDLNVPDLGGSLALAGTGLSIGPNTVLTGAGGVLYLPQDKKYSAGAMSFDFNACPSAGSGAVDTSKGSYVAWDAVKGLGNVVINADITFPGNKSIVAVDASDKRLTTPASIHARFAFSDWNDWVATATLSNDFELAGLPGFPIHSDGLFYDHSTKQNPVAIGFPAGYVGAQDASFEGLYIPSLAMSLPGSFQSFSGAKTGAIKFQNFILDNSGVTTTISATNVLDISTGSLGGWAFSIDKISIAVVQDNFQNGMAMTGQIKLPIASDGLAYTCALNSADGQVNYQFVVKPSGDLNVPLWLASIDLDANSSLVIQNDAAGIDVKTHLNGSIGITIGKTGSLQVTLPGLSFQDMAMANRADTSAGAGAGFFFSAGKWSLGGGVPIPAGFTGLQGLEGDVAAAFAGPSAAEGGPNVIGDAGAAGDAPFADGSSQGTIAGFSLELSDFAPYFAAKSSTSVEAGVYFNIKVGIGFGDASVVSGGARLGILGEIDVPGTSAPSASFDKIDCDSVGIYGAVGPVTVSGKLGFRNGDKTYGDGIYGSLSADLVFAKFDAAGQFGTAPAGFHYWAIGGSIYLPAGIVVGPGLTVNGFGGGVFYNMQLTTPGPNDPQLHSTTPGEIPMVPVSGTIGIQAELLVAAIQPDVCNGSVLLTGTIVNGGLGQLRMDGNAAIVTNAPENTTSLVNASMTMVYDFVKKSYDLQVQVTVSFLIGNATGELWVHGGPDGEYIYVGEPDNRVTLNLLDINLSLLKVKLSANAYFDVGTELPAFPALPPQVAVDQGDKSANDAAVGSFLQQISRPDPKTGLSPNAGIMFGAQVSGSIDLDLLFLYASVDATIGFDVALLHVTNPPPGCIQNGTFGYNNWYGMGQFYAAFHLDVGLHVDAWFFHGDVDLVTFDAICVLQAGLPNPTWVDGNVTVSGSALGGLVSVSGEFPFSFGDKCVIQEDPLDGIQMITDIGPTDSASVFADPTAAYSVPMDNTDYPIQVPSDNDHPKPYTRTFRFSVVQFNLSKVMKDGSDSLAAGLNQGSGFDMSGDGLGSTLYPKTMLEPHTKYSMYIQCQVKELTDAGLVTPAESHGGLQDTTYTFTTGSAPYNIPAANVAYTYPTDGQRFFLKNEFGQRGTIKIGTWQYDILPASSVTAGQYDYLVYFISSKADTVTTSFTLNKPLSSLDFTIPATLRNSEIYDMQVWVKPRQLFTGKSLAPTISQKLDTKTTNVTQQSATFGANGGYTQTASKQLVSTVAIKKNYVTLGAQTHPLGSVPIFTLRFQTSQYNSFQQKISAYGQWTSQAENANKDIVLTAAAAPESFDEFEIKGTTNVCSTCDPNTIPKNYPPMFNAAIPWNNSVQNDKYASDNLYANAFEMEFFNVAMDLGASQVRDLLIPDNCVSNSMMPYQPRLAPFLQSLGAVSKESLVNGSSMALTSASGKSSGSGSGSNSRVLQTFVHNNAVSANGGGNTGGSGVSFVARGMTIGLPASYISTSSGSKGGPAEMEMTPTLTGSTSIVTTASSPRLVWMHDDYIYADYSLLHQFGVNFIANQSNVVYMPYMGDVPLAVLNAMNGADLVFATGEYGSISMDAAHYMTRYNDPALTRVANSLSGVGFQALPPSSHTLQLKYMYPFCGPCGVGSVVPQTVNYELITHPAVQKMILQR
jgi:hypothetical protein